MRECPSCHLPTPEGRFCVRCGASLGTPGDAPEPARPARGRSQFAAAPGERRYAPWLVSTLFPQLPHHSERHFRLVLAGGIAVVAALGAFGLFGVALLTAALLMPVLTGMYFHDVDIYEREPGWAAALTYGWGALAGAAAAVVSRAAAPTVADQLDRSSGYHVLTGGVVIPAVGVLLALGGPLILLPYRRFNETLDGAAFGAASAAAFAAAQAVVVGLGVLGGGLHPGGAVAPWVARLLAVAVATPVLMMSAGASAAAALWLRYRAPVTDRRALGALGQPAIALAVAVALVVAGTVTETFLPAGAWLGCLVVLDLVGLTLLRRAIHLGLLEESAEREIGPDIRCANCGAVTAQHSFCAACGVALKALPKPPAHAAAGSYAGRLGSAGSGGPAGTAGLAATVSARRRAGAFLAALSATVGAGFLIAVVAAAAPRAAPCAAHAQCGSPPVLPVFPGYTRWRSPALGYSLRYGIGDWRVLDQTGTGVTLQSHDGFSQLSVDAAPAGAAGVSALRARRLGELQRQLLGLAPDTSPSDELLGPLVGLRAASASGYVATVSSPQGPQSPVLISLLGSADSRISLLVTVIVAAGNEDQRKNAYQSADDIINSIQWPGT